MADFANCSRLVPAALVFASAALLVGCSDSDEDEVSTDAADTTDSADSTDTTEPSDTPPAEDILEAFCECDDDCLPLEDGSLCNGTVCTFGVEGTPCDEPDAEDAPDVEDDAPDADAPDLAPDIAEDAEPDVAEDAEPEAET
jgi:hypothetical protein